jgi:hypothetical protein
MKNNGLKKFCGKIIWLTMLYIYPTLCSAQNIDEIRSKISEYVYGEGEGTTLARADDMALIDLLRKISVTVRGISLQKKERLLQVGLLIRKLHTKVS